MGLEEKLTKTCIFSKILKEMKYILDATGAVIYLHLVKELHKNDLDYHSGTIYGYDEMNTFLDACNAVMSAYHFTT